MRRTGLALAVASFLLASPFHATADNGAYSGAGGSFSAGTSVGAAISAQSVPVSGSTLSFSCPITFFGAGTYQWNWTCAGGSVTVTGSTLSMSGTFISGTMALTASGGGKGGNTAYWYVFSGTIKGKVTANGVSESYYGSISTTVKTTSQIGTGSAPVTSLSMGWNSAYSPVIVGDPNNGRLLGADNLTGGGLVYYGTYGSGTNQFESIAGLAQDATKRIYITDSTLNRLVRIDNLAGKNWVELGSSGTGNLHFSGPRGVTVDSAGAIWVADASNNRIVKFTDMTGANWTSFGTLGTGANQFSAPAAIAFDSTGRIYVADSGNNRLVRFDNLTGANWTTLSMLNLDPYGYPLNGVNGVNVTPTGQIFVTTPNGWLLSPNDMTGVGGTVSTWSPSIYGFSRDKAGTVYLAGGFTPPLGQTVNGIGTGYFGGSLGLPGLAPSTILAQATTTPPPAAAVISTTKVTFGNQNVGELGEAHKISLTNLGGQAMTISSITASADFKVTSTCPVSLSGGNTCAISLQFDPTVTGPRTATLVVDTTGAHSVLKVALSGTGTAPTAVLGPTSMKFNPQLQGTTSSAQSATLSNTGTGPLTIPSIVATGDFSRSSNCPAVLAAGAGCTLQVKFTPSAAGTLTGALTISDDAIPTGTMQQITLTGTGSATTPSFTLSPASLLFPNQQINVSSSAQIITLKNSSTAKVSLGAATIPANFKGTTTCTSSLAAGASCTHSIQFDPTMTGPLSGTLSVPITGQTTLVAGLSGTGVNPSSPALTITPNPLNFTGYVVGDNPTANITVANKTGFTVGIRSISLTGSSVFTKTGNNCPAILAIGASCTVKITFIPTAAASYSATLTVMESSGSFTPEGIAGTATLTDSLQPVVR